MTEVPQAPLIHRLKALTSFRMNQSALVFTDSSINKVPTIEQLKAAGKDGLRVRNPDNGKEFRVVYYCWEGCVHGLKFFDLDAKPRARPLKGILMPPGEIANYLEGIRLIETPAPVAAASSVL